jgi:hypothetical protein
MWLSDMQSTLPSNPDAQAQTEGGRIIMEVCKLTLSSDRDWGGILLGRYVWSLADQKLFIDSLAGGLFLFGGVLMFFDRAM